MGEWVSRRAPQPRRSQPRRSPCRRASSTTLPPYERCSADQPSPSSLEASGMLGVTMVASGSRWVLIASATPASDGHTCGWTGWVAGWVGGWLAGRLAGWLRECLGRAWARSACCGTPALMAASSLQNNWHAQPGGLRITARGQCISRCRRRRTTHTHARKRAHAVLTICGQCISRCRHQHRVNHQLDQPLCLQLLRNRFHHL